MSILIPIIEKKDEKSDKFQYLTFLHFQLKSRIIAKNALNIG